MMELKKASINDLEALQQICKEAYAANTIQQARTLEKKTLFLCVIDTNDAAIRAYEKAGFKFHSKTRLEGPFFREELRGMNRMFIAL